MIKHLLAYECHPHPTGESSFLITMKLIIGLQILCSMAVAMVSAMERRPRELLAQSRPFLESYWESYSRFPNRFENFGCQNITDWTDSTAYGYDLASIPIAGGTCTGVNVVNIAFASGDISR